MIDSAGKEVGFYDTKDAAEHDLHRAMKDDVMWEKAQTLVASAIKAHMEVHGVDLDTSRYWIRSAAEAADSCTRDLDSCNRNQS
ncbi:MAG: hypothetical protein ACHP8A_15445 [Terriglobales bacterium]